MIARTFLARATQDGAARYARFFADTLVPGLRGIEGHQGALVLQRNDGAEVAITVITFWESMDAVARFAGPTPDRAVVEPEAREILLGFDEIVRHHEVAVDTLR
jgi:heme-degrading monooxygenase HmoA